MYRFELCTGTDISGSAEGGIVYSTVRCAVCSYSLQYPGTVQDPYSKALYSTVRTVRVKRRYYYNIRYQSPCPCLKLGPRWILYMQCFYNHAHHPSPVVSGSKNIVRYTYTRYQASRSSNGFVLVLLDPGGGFTSETAARRFHERNCFGSETNTNL
jgi:hypothetical protein